MSEEGFAAHDGSTFALHLATHGLVTCSRTHAEPQAAFDATPTTRLTVSQATTSMHMFWLFDLVRSGTLCLDGFIKQEKSWEFTCPRKPSCCSAKASKRPHGRLARAKTACGGPPLTHERALEIMSEIVRSPYATELVQHCKTRLQKDYPPHIWGPFACDSLFSCK